MTPRRINSEKKRASRSRLASIAAIFALVGFGAGFAIPAFAGTAYSDYWNFPVGSTYYANRASVVTSPNYGYARTSMQRSGGTTAFYTGEVGARGRLFINGSKTNMQCQGTTVYNPGVVYIQYGFSCSVTVPGTWNSYGVGYVWNGSSYSAYYTYNSPSQNT